MAAAALFERGTREFAAAGIWFSSRLKRVIAMNNVTLLCFQASGIAGFGKFFAAYLVNLPVGADLQIARKYESPADENAPRRLTVAPLVSSAERLGFKIDSWGIPAR